MDVDYWKSEVTAFDVELCFYSSFDVEFKVKVKVGNSSILNFKLIWIDAMLIITESRIDQ